MTEPQGAVLKKVTTELMARERTKNCGCSVATEVYLTTDDQEMHFIVYRLFPGRHGGKFRGTAQEYQPATSDEQIAVIKTALYRMIDEIDLRLEDEDRNVLVPEEIKHVNRAAE